MMKKPDSSIFYSLEYINSHRKLASSHPHWGTFLSVKQCKDDFPAEYESQLANYVIYKTIDFSPYEKMNPVFGSIIEKMSPQNQVNYYRCSSKYYFDCFNVLTHYAGKVNRIVEVGPQFGDVSCLFAGTLQDMNTTLDLVDVNPFNLMQAYEKIKQGFPEAISRVRLFFGDLPLYIKRVTLLSSDINFIHYQGSCNFNDVVRDLGATSYAKQKIAGTMIHNVHLRTTDMCHYAFVDIAIYALFGLGVQLIPVGEEASGEVELNSLEKPSIYFTDKRVDGMYLPYDRNYFRYPHYNTSLDDFIEDNKVEA